MESLLDGGLRLQKHIRWSPSPVDLSVTTSISPSHLLQGIPRPLISGKINGLGSASSLFSSRKQREFIPDSKKDDCYWDRRRRNNEAAKRSREKRRISDMVLEGRVLELTRENAFLKAELLAIKEKFGLPSNQHFVDPDVVSIPIPDTASRGRRNKLLTSIITTNNPIDQEIFNAIGNINCQMSSSSPDSSSSSISEPILSPNSLVNNSSNDTVPISSSGDSTLSSSTSVCNGSQGKVSSSCITSPSCLPHKLRHKASRNSVQHPDSDSGSENNGHGGQIDCSLKALNLNESIKDSQGKQFEERRITKNLENNLMVENFSLRQELTKLASEVSSLKNYLKPINDYGSRNCEDMIIELPEI
ncbi:uncharacterized protein LOC141858412 isoform X2 [Brevipalpus obovatus]|uniref:uncharacterized protein LOC141858412 isoform X2 n=1 Tax=Brevipalpus obovatus TaxID=246614 RepID=UPI003D9F4526